MKVSVELQFLPRLKPWVSLEDSYDGGILGRLEKEAIEKNVPIVGPHVGKLLYILAKAVDAKRVLELGSATGYSAIWMAKAIAPVKGRITTVEWDRGSAETTKANIEESGNSEFIKVLQGDARVVLMNLKKEDPFDMVFVDIEKEYYSEVLDPSIELLKPKGLMVFDNTAFKTAGDFLEISNKHPDIEAIHLYGFLPGHGPEHDAITICVKK